MAIYDFDTFADYCAGILTSTTRGVPTCRELADFAPAIIDYALDYVRTMHCAKAAAVLRFVRVDALRGKVSAVVFKTGGAWLAVCRDGDSDGASASAKKFTSFADLWNYLRDRETRKEVFYSLYQKGDGATAQLLRKVR